MGRGLVAVVCYVAKLTKIRAGTLDGQHSCHEQVTSCSDESYSWRALILAWRGAQHSTGFDTTFCAKNRNLHKCDRSVARTKVTRVEQAVVRSLTG